MKFSKWFMVLLPALCCCGMNIEQPQNEIKEVEIGIDRSYEEVSNYELVWETIFDIEEEHYYVYFYSTTCNHCLEIKNYIIEKALSRGDIYFVKGTSKDNLTNDSKKLIGAENPNDFYILGYPTLGLISNKKCTKNLSGTTQIKAELK